MNSASGSLRNRLFGAFILVTAIAALVPALFSRSTLYAERVRLAEKQALMQASFAKEMVEADLDGEQKRAMFETAGKLGFRMTLTDSSGRVVMDSHIGESALPELDSHADRPEIEDARTQGRGVSLRHSNSLGIDAVYAAVSMQNGGILRVSVPLAEVENSFESEFLPILLSILGAAIVCLLLAAFFTARVRNGLNDMAEVVATIAGYTGKRLRDVPGKEFLPLAYAVNYMADTIEEHVRVSGEQQTRLETILDSMHEGVLVLDGSGRIESWNRTFSLFFTEIENAVGKPLIEGLPIPALQREVDAVLQGKGEDKTTVPSAAVHFELPAGRFLVAHVSGPARGNKSLGAVVVVYDATELMRLESVRRDFVANVSHELRTPLTAIAAYAETLMTADGIDEEYRSFAGIIHKHAASLGKTVGDLLDLARIENSRDPMRFASADAGQLAAEAHQACREQFEAKSVTLATKLDGGMIAVNGPLVTQVFRNLLENACRYSPDGGIVSLSSQRQGDEVLFTVTDNGPGIPQDALPRIFERFYQVKKERNSGTSGVGLAICKHIIERHGGRIWAESPYGDAATAMLFTLPAARSQE